MRNSHGGIRLPAEQTSRGEHPDLTPDGNLRPEALVWDDAEERDFNTRFANDPGFAGHFMDRVTERQSQEPEWIQREVAGQTFGAGRGPYRGFSEYQQRLAELRAEEDTYKYGSGATVIRDSQIEGMSLEEFDAAFDQHGRPRPGVVFERTNRSVRLDDGIDPYSAGELRNR